MRSWIDIVLNLVLKYSSTRVLKYVQYSTMTMSLSCRLSKALFFKDRYNVMLMSLFDAARWLSLGSLDLFDIVKFIFIDSAVSWVRAQGADTLQYLLLSVLEYSSTRVLVYSSTQVRYSSTKYSSTRALEYLSTHQYSSSTTNSTRVLEYEYLL